MDQEVRDGSGEGKQQRQQQQQQQQAPQAQPPPLESQIGNPALPHDFRVVDAKDHDHDDDDDADSTNSYMDSLFVSEHNAEDDWAAISPAAMVPRTIRTAAAWPGIAAASSAPTALQQQQWLQQQQQQQRQQELMHQQVVLMLQSDRRAIAAAAAPSTRGAASSSSYRHQLDHNPVGPSHSHHPMTPPLPLPYHLQHPTGPHKTSSSAAASSTQSSSYGPHHHHQQHSTVITSAMTTTTTMTTAPAAADCYDGHDHDDVDEKASRPLTKLQRHMSGGSTTSSSSSQHGPIKTTSTAADYLLDDGTTPLTRLFALDSHENPTWRGSGGSPSTAAAIAAAAARPPPSLDPPRQAGSKRMAAAAGIPHVPITSMSPSLVIATMGLNGPVQKRARASPPPPPPPTAPHQQPQKVLERLWQQAMMMISQPHGPGTTNDDHSSSPPLPLPRVRAGDAKYDTVPSPLQLASYGTAVIAAVHGDDTATLDTFFRAGLSRNPCNQFRDSLLDYACQHAKASVVRCFVDHGAELCVCDAHGRTPLHYCAWSHVFCESIVTTILQADPQQLYQEDKDGKTPLEMVSPIAAADWCAFLARYYGQRPPPPPFPAVASAIPEQPMMLFGHPTTGGGSSVHHHHQFMFQCLEHRVQLADPPRPLSITAAKALAASGVLPATTTTA
jgi:hypothetical protein